ncbi:acyl-coenzyme A thioesterase 13-like [Prunus yedoensis var. nudiflora]|uniref:Acyl-coenzyme A thioesterase 13 n=1 Tax=Prunus yedoensis var. nudiflora TaxID=2094558 RepID=A0A314XJA8_PRUYE|nr:acyl-coenzyme A thioesterase 13-like [Prunus yedoensis var. nudiflora]
MEMRKVNKSLELTQDESEAVSQLVIPATRYGESSFYEAFALQGIRLDRVEPGVLVVCSFKVPPRLADRSGNLANGAIANLVDIVGGAVAYVPGLSMNVSVDISISYVSTAKLHDELEITSRMLGRVGGCSGTKVILRNKTTGEIIAEDVNDHVPSFRASKHALYIATLIYQWPERVLRETDPNDEGEMERAKKFLGLSQDESEAVSRLDVPERQAGEGKSFYDTFALAGNRVVRVEPGLIVCYFKVPPRLTDRTGKLANGAIANLVDVVGISVDFVEGLPMNVSVDMSISYLSTAKLDDELEIISKRLGQRGGCTGTLVLVRNKATGVIIAEGRLSLFRPQASSKL